MKGLIRYRHIHYETNYQLEKHQSYDYRSHLWLGNIYRDFSAGSGSLQL